MMNPDVSVGDFVSTLKIASQTRVLQTHVDKEIQKHLVPGLTDRYREYCAQKIQHWWLSKHPWLRPADCRQQVNVEKNGRFQRQSETLESKTEMEGQHDVSQRYSLRWGHQAGVEHDNLRRGQEEDSYLSGMHQHHGEKMGRNVPLSEMEAAITIQRAWRRHIDIQVYRYYRDLINFQSRGDPSMMLRCINPIEAKLLDAASGASVRFRLAGDKFPPNIYYKIFTHRPIQDLCANSPKDYTSAASKQLTAKDQHNRIHPLPAANDRSQWYKRFENNGWRLVSDRLIHHIMNDPVAWESSQKKYSFDHSKLKRKQDVEKLKKERKIEWMKKMYKQGMLHAKADNHETVQLIEGAAAGMIATVERQGPDSVEDWEVDELLDWTTSLNFDEGWKHLATSAPANSKIEKATSIGSSSVEHYELTVSMAPSRFPSTRQSHRTQASMTGSIHIVT